LRDASLRPPEAVVCFELAGALSGWQLAAGPMAVGVWIADGHQEKCPLSGAPDGIVRKRSWGKLLESS